MSNKAEEEIEKLRGGLKRLHEIEKEHNIKRPGLVVRPKGEQDEKQT